MYLRLWALTAALFMAAPSAFAYHRGGQGSALQYSVRSLAQAAQQLSQALSYGHCSDNRFEHAAEELLDEVQDFEREICENAQVDDGDFREVEEAYNDLLGYAMRSQELRNPNVQSAWLAVQQYYRDMRQAWVQCDASMGNGGGFPGHGGGFPGQGGGYPGQGGGFPGQGGGFPGQGGGYPGQGGGYPGQGGGYPGQGGGYPGQGGGYPSQGGGFPGTVVYPGSGGGFPGQSGNGGGFPGNGGHPSNGGGFPGPGGNGGGFPGNGGHPGHGGGFPGQGGGNGGGFPGSGGHPGHGPGPH